MEKTHCLACNQVIVDPVYAVYSPKENEEVVGFLCDACRSKQKIKRLNNPRGWDQLQKVKEILEQPPGNV
jgi:hypothetical protein